eukprot:155463-Rhodomonas_salina.3
MQLFSPRETADLSLGRGLGSEEGGRSRGAEIKWILGLVVDGRKREEAFRLALDNMRGSGISCWRVGSNLCERKP